jgi:hypothetical protein
MALTYLANHEPVDSLQIPHTDGTPVNVTLLAAGSHIIAAKAMSS